MSGGEDPRRVADYFVVAGLPADVGEQQGSILQNSISAENFSYNFSSSSLCQISTPKITDLNMYE
jgi:hypothetical protein